MRNEYTTQQAGKLTFTDIQCLHCNEYSVWSIESGVHLCTNCSNVWHNERSPSKEEIQTIRFLLQNIREIDKEARTLQAESERNRSLNRKVLLMGRVKDYL